MTDLPVQSDLLEQYYEQGNFAEYKKVAHKLKNSLKYIGYENLPEYNSVILSVLKTGAAEFEFSKEELVKLILKCEYAMQELKIMVEQAQNNLN